MSERTFIDPEKFALTFSREALQKGLQVDEYVDKAKEQLLAYLTAYYLIQDFNGSESKNFQSGDAKKFKDLTFDELLTRVARLNKY